MAEANHGGNLTIKTRKLPAGVRISFADNGPGIPKEDVPKIFDPFFTINETGNGTGLGLSICHGIVTEHGGKIYARSKVGQGTTTISIELPANGGRIDS